MKYYDFSLGCKVNSYENSAIGQELLLKGYQKALKPEEADILLLNTCSVTAQADQKSRQHISKFRRANPRAVFVVMGCYSQKHAEIALELGADIVLGTSRRSEIASLIEEFQANHQKINAVQKQIRRISQYEELGCHAYSEAARAFLKVQDGCDNFCSYCLIPSLRGASRSRRPGEVIAEARALCADGYKEIVITGIETGFYGKDLGDGSYRLPSLLADLIDECPSLARLRISSLEESEIDEAFLNLLKCHQIANHLHIPLQSGSAGILERMKRKYRPEDYLKKLAAIRAIRPDIAITTDLIAGFPSESEEEWHETLDFCEACGFSEIHVFPFSARPGTYAATLPPVEAEVKKRRVHEALALSKRLRTQYEAGFLGKDLEVLFESYDDLTKFAYGHTSNYLLVKVPSSTSLHGQLKMVEYTPSTIAD